MATYTPNNNLKKPAGTDYVLVGDLNGNMDILDGKIGDLSQLSTPSKQSIQAAINDAAEMGGGHPPYFDDTTLTWWQWDQATAQYVDTTRPASATVEVGTVTTVAPSNPATVDNSGTDLDVVLNFEIPQGVPGTAATITAGNTTTLSPDQPAVVTQRGTAQARIFDFDIPRGETGAGLAILGHYDTVADLQTEHPAGNPGDMYSIGTAAPYDMYIWDEPTGAWVNEGPISGSGGTVKSWNEIDPDEEGNISVDSGNLPFDASAETPTTTKEAISALVTEMGEIPGIYIPASEKGAVNGVAALDGSGGMTLAGGMSVPQFTLTSEVTWTQLTLINGAVGDVYIAKSGGFTILKGMLTDLSAVPYFAIICNIPAEYLPEFAVMVFCFDGYSIQQTNTLKLILLPNPAGLRMGQTLNNTSPSGTYVYWFETVFYSGV